MGRTCYSYGGTESYKKSPRCSGRRKKTEGQAEIEMGRWCDGRRQEVSGEKLKECCKEQEKLAEASEEGLGSKGAVVPMVMMMMMMNQLTCITSEIVHEHVQNRRQQREEAFWWRQPLSDSENCTGSCLLQVLLIGKH